MYGSSTVFSLSLFSGYSRTDFLLQIGRHSRERWAAGEVWLISSSWESDLWQTARTVRECAEKKEEDKPEGKKWSPGTLTKISWILKEHRTCRKNPDVLCFASNPWCRSMLVYWNYSCLTFGFYYSEMKHRNRGPSFKLSNVPVNAKAVLQRMEDLEILAKAIPKTKEERRA